MTALFNYLYARSQGGKFVLRLEDTDRNRFVEGAAEQLMSSLKWAGLEYDEGPDAGGDFGPYVQSERLEIYRAHVEKLLASGDAYYCFCTPEELDAMRERMTAAGQTPKYDGTWRDRPAAEVQAQLDAGVPHVVRLKMPLHGETSFKDMIRGVVSFQNEMMDDQVLLKSDGFPTYHLAVVVDDHQMGITHIIRGEEWLASVPKHLRLYEAFGWEPPKMAHLSLLLNPDRSKLSKRQGDVAVEDYMAKGYLAAALVNFVALLGWNPGTEEEIFSLEELVDRFEMERVSKSGAVFDIDKLKWMNGHYLRELPEDARIKFITSFLEKAGADISDADRNKIIAEAVYKRIDTGEDAYNAARIFYNDELTIEEEEAMAVLKEQTAGPVLEAFLTKLDNMEELNMDTFKGAMKEIQQESGIKGQPLWKPVRIAMTGEISGPDLPLVMAGFGKAKVRSFIQQALEKYV